MLDGDQTAIEFAPWFHPILGTQVLFDAGSNATIISVVPEPASLLMLGGTLFAFARRRKH